MSNSTDMVKREQSSSEITRAQTPGTRKVAPLVDVYENADGLLLLADMPGVLPDDLHLDFEDGELSIRGTQQPPADTADTFVPLEFQRVFTIPQTIDAEKVTAELTGGVLRIVLGKSEAAKPKRIQVNAG